MEQKKIFRQASVDRVSSPEQLDKYIKVITPGAAVTLLCLVCLVCGGLVWGIFGKIPVTANAPGVFYSSPGGNLSDEVVCSVQEETAFKLKVGMEVQISPNQASREKYGFIYGTVKAIDIYPASVNDIVEIVRNEELAKNLIEQQSGVKVIISLEKKGEELKWSMEKSTDVEIKNGMQCSSQFVLKTMKPIDLVLNNEEA